jgi:hypothetical protein
VHLIEGAIEDADPDRRQVERNIADSDSHNGGEHCNVDVVVLNDIAALSCSSSTIPIKTAVLETAERTKSIHHLVNFLLLPEPGYEKLLRLP